MYPKDSCYYCKDDCDNITENSQPIFDLLFFFLTHGILPRCWFS